MKELQSYLEGLNACEEAVLWSKEFNTLKEAWEVCERGDWMLWLLGKQSGPVDSDSRKKLVWTSCQCARLALPCVKEGEDKPRIAIEAAEAYAINEASIEDVRNAATAATAAAHTDDAAATAATAAAHTADDAAANAAAYAAAAAANAAAYAAAAYAAAAYAAARRKTLKQCANIIRENYPNIEMI
jgi:hypothetical protein